MLESSRWVVPLMLRKDKFNFRQDLWWKNNRFSLISSSRPMKMQFEWSVNLLTTMATIEISALLIEIRRCSRALQIQVRETWTLRIFHLHWHPHRLASRYQRTQHSLIPSMLQLTIPHLKRAFSKTHSRASIHVAQPNESIIRIKLTIVSFNQRKASVMIL